MTLILVTGLSGAGKSTVYREFLARGIEAFGLDGSRKSASPNSAQGT